MNDRLKFRTPYYLPDPDGKDQFIGFEHWNAIGGRPKMMVSWGKDEQCTGLKDKNGNLIYEGDVVKSMIRTGYIKWNKGNMTWFVYVLKSNEIIALNSYLDGELEIIGNIHEQKDAA